MAKDEKGFAYPAIDYGLCNKCGLCDRICAFKDDYSAYGDNPAIYAVKNKDEDVRKNSTSGGMFAAISDKVLQDGGTVYGAGYTHRLCVCHKRAATKKERDEFMGSKYVQSDIGDSFARVKEDLDANLGVLFTGAPCQVVALKSFLRRDYQKLFTLDLVCHGVPSDKLWQDFLDVIEEDTKDRVVHAEFRNKDAGWHRPMTKLFLERGGIRRIKGEQSFFQLFVVNYMLMPACHNCKFSNFRRSSDITLGDFWGIERTMPDFDDDKGVSLVLVNSERGKTMFKDVACSLDIRQSSKKDCLQRNLQAPPPRHRDSDKFWRDYHKGGMRRVMKRYSDYSDIRTFCRKVVRRLRRMLKLAPQ
jgi:coenzyme F420-reducing hydrogenase beta subunit